MLLVGHMPRICHEEDKERKVQNPCKEGQYADLQYPFYCVLGTFHLKDKDLNQGDQINLNRSHKSALSPTILLNVEDAYLYSSSLFLKK